MDLVEQRISELGISLPTAAPPMAALLSPTRLVGDRLIVSAQTPKKNGKLAYCGKVGSAFGLAGGQEATALCALNVLAHAKVALAGELSRIKAIISVRGYINVEPDFFEIAEVLNGASKVLLDIFGHEVGSHTRMALGAASMPFNATAEVEAEFWISDAGGVR